MVQNRNSILSVAPHLHHKREDAEQINDDRTVFRKIMYNDMEGEEGLYEKKRSLK
jgi:hypothetical protein